MSLDKLQQWSRKYYTWEIHSGPHIQPGDGTYVRLSGGGRSVCVSDIELEKWDEETGETTHYPTLDELIEEALRLWHADRTPKLFRLLWWDSQLTPVPDTRPHLPGKSYYLDKVFETEQEALDYVTGIYQSAGRVPESKVYVWEKGAAK